MRLSDGIIQLAQEKGFSLDGSQLKAVQTLQALLDQLMDVERAPSFFSRLLKPRSALNNIYLWGSVGRGKSFLMDSFFKFVPLEKKRRIHFHRFMQEVHQRMNAISGVAEPLSQLAKAIALETRLLCLDEFHITDITDAMLMRKLLEGLRAERVVIVTTSNFEPDSLYLHGLQRNQFLPAIRLIKESFNVINVDAGIDYRLRELTKAGVYHIGEDAEMIMNQTFGVIAHEPGFEPGTIEIDGRFIPIKRLASEVAWFEFSALCDGPRGKPDYIELSKRYHTVMISNLARFGSGSSDKLRRFVWMIDEFYDRRVKVVLSAPVRAEDLILAADSKDAFQMNLNASLKERLVSRLTEMQSHDYLAQPHIP